MALGGTYRRSAGWRIRSAQQPIARFLDSRWAGVACFGTALAVFGIESLAWPLRGGRDSTTYLMYYVDIWHRHPAYPFLMLFRTPIAPLFFGPLLQLGGAALTEVGLGIAYALSILAFALVARQAGRSAAVLAAIALLLLPGYGALFHQVSSDPIYAFVFAGFCLVATRAIQEPSNRWFALCAVAFMGLVLTRPGSQALIAFGLLPLALPGPWRARCARSASYLGVALILLLGWAGYNGWRYGDFTIARSVWLGTPFYRTFVMEQIVRPSNGPASAELARVVAANLLTKEPYRRERITTAQFFKVETDREWGDLVVLSDLHWGWSSNYAILRRAGFEAVRAHWHLYVRDVAAGAWDEVTVPYQWDVVRLLSATSGHPAPLTRKQIAANAAQAADPGGYRWWLMSTPAGPHVVASRVERQAREVGALSNDLPDRSGSPAVARILNSVSRGYPWMAIWIALGALGVVAFRIRAFLVPASLTAGALLVLLVTLLGYPPNLEYGLPFDPIYVVFGMTAVTAAAQRTAGISRRRSEGARGSAGHIA